ncbi:hypothetical protein B0H13DRAFT_2686538 [Mycena leptocephala]|nr:hypothetical protein B0H13DRAFT_2686538 [Mycena leptocephala]
MVEWSFPLELEQEIFETTALRHPGTIPTLLRLCHRVHIWIEPFLYRVLCFDNFDLDESLLIAVESKPPVFLQNAVRHALIFDFNPRATQRFQKLLMKCTGIVNLVFDGTLDPELLQALNKMHLQKLLLTVPSDLSTWPLAGLRHPVFLSVTHLDLGEDQGDAGSSCWQEWSYLASLPALTRLAVSVAMAECILPEVVAHCPRLRVVIVVTYTGSWDRDLAIAFAQNITITDSRAVVMALATNYKDDWILGTRGSDDFWTRAETFVTRKRAGEIDTTCYLLDETATTIP